MGAPCAMRNQTILAWPGTRTANRPPACIATTMPWMWSRCDGVSGSSARNPCKAQSVPTPTSANTTAQAASLGNRTRRPILLRPRLGLLRGCGCRERHIHDDTVRVLDELDWAGLLQQTRAVQLIRANGDRQTGSQEGIETVGDTRIQRRRRLGPRLILLDALGSVRHQVLAIGAALRGRLGG